MGYPSHMWFIENQTENIAIIHKIRNVLEHTQSKFQTIDVVETEEYGKMLFLDGNAMFSDADEFCYHEMIVHISLCAHPNPEDILVIGGGDGGTVREIAKHNCVKSITMVEIDEIVTKVCRKHFPKLTSALDDPRVDLKFEDGIAFIKKPPKKYDVIIVDSTDPVGPAEGLFSEDFYKNAAKTLKPNGILVSQTETYYFVKDKMRKIYENINTGFKNVWIYWTHMPVYPTGLWTFCFATNSKINPTKQLNSERVSTIARKCKYYDYLVHLCSFGVPSYLRKNLEGLVRNGL